MKKIFILTLVFTLLLSIFCGCQKEDETDPDIQSSLYKAEFETLDELKAAWKIAKQKQEQNEELSIDEALLVVLEQIPNPIAEVEGYFLKNIQVSKFCVHYVYFREGATQFYMPDENGNLVRQAMEYIFSVEDFGDMNGFEIVAEQSRTQDQLEPTEDGVFYDERSARMVFSVGNSYCILTVPDFMNQYDTILSLCQYEIITLSE